MDSRSARVLIISTKELPTALEIVATTHHWTYDFPLNGGVRCTSLDGRRKCRNMCSRVAVAQTCHKHTKPEQILIDSKGKRSAEWIALAMDCAKRPRKFCASYSAPVVEHRARV